MSREKLKRWKVEMEFCAPVGTGEDELLEYLTALIKESDVSEINDIFAAGGLEITEEEEISLEEWNGDPIIRTE